MLKFKCLFVLAILTLFLSCQKSENNYLLDITISTGKIIPPFSKDVNEYFVTSLNSLKPVIIKTRTEDPNSKVIYNVDFINDSTFLIKSLDKSNDIVITVSAENGAKKVYRIKTLPPDFPPLIVKQNKYPAPGYISLANFSLNPAFTSEYGKYLMIVDNYGKPVYYQKVPLGAADFRPQPGGKFSYFNPTYAKPPEIFGEFVLMDNDFDEIGRYKTKHGYTDMHEFHLMDNGNVYMLGVDIIEKNLLSIGGNPKAKIWDYFIEQTGINGDVIMNWQSFNTFKVTDLISAYDLTLPYIEHGANCNSVIIEKDGNIILSSRKLDELTKIDSKTGKIIWRMGGIQCKNNEFKFINDPLNGFSHQHSISRLNNGNILMVDNGNYNSAKALAGNIFFIPQTRIVEYKIDEVKKTAELVWQYQKNGMFVPIMGSAQRLDNGNTLICWSKDKPCITEVDKDGNILLEMEIPKGYQCYSAYKFNL